MTNELKPCPFCGGKARKFREATIPPGEEYVVCLKSSGVNPTCRNDAVLKVDAWNTRPLEDELRAEAASGELWADEYHKQMQALQAEVSAVKVAYSRLMNYRHNNTLNFQLEKLDDYLRELNDALEGGE